MAPSYTKVERAGELAILTLNRPEKRNALNTAFRDEIRTALEELERDEAIRVVILASTGRAFCAGFDTSEFQAQSPEQVFASESTARYHHRLQHFAKPLVAAINGPAMGGGFDIAVLCDVRVAAEEASFGHPEIKFGAPTLYPPLAAIVGGGIARDLCLSGRTIDAREAHRIGLVSRVVPLAELVDAATEVARQIAEAPAATLRSVKLQIVSTVPERFSDA